MNKMYNKIISISIFTCVLAASLYYFYSRDLAKKDIKIDSPIIEKQVSKDPSIYMNKFYSEGINYDDLSDSDKKSYYEFYKKFTEDDKPIDAVRDYEYFKESTSVLYIDQKLVLYRLSGTTTCAGLKLVSKSDNQVLSMGCFVNQFTHGDDIFSVDDSYGVVVYKAGSDKIVILPNSEIDKDGETYTRENTYYAAENTADLIPANPVFKIVDKTIILNVYSRQDGSFVKTVSFELP